MTPHNPWALLGIAPTQEVRDVKRAYAARLKAVRPDDDPAGFQALREAYEWALRQCNEQPAPAPVVHLHIGQQALPSYRIDIPAQPAAPDAHAQPIWRAPPSSLGTRLWQDWRSSLQIDDNDLSHARVEALADQLRDCLRHSDLVNFDTREAFTNAAFDHCASSDAPGALRLACAAVFHWSHAAMPLDPWARERWVGLVERIEGDRQYREMQELAQHDPARRWVLERLTQPGQPQIRWRQFLNAHFLAMARDTLRRVHTDWQQALRFRLNAAALPVLDEMASLPWPAWPPDRIGLGVFGALPTLLLLVAFLNFTSFAVALILALLSVASLTVLLVLSRIAYALWVVPPLRRSQQRANRMRAALQARWPRHHTAQRIWLGVRMAVPTAAFFVPLLPPWYAEGVRVALAITALLHVASMLLLRGLWSWIAPLMRAFLIYVSICIPLLWMTFKPLLGGVAMPWVLLLSDTFFYGLRDVLQPDHQRTWNTPRVRRIALASAVALLLLQWPMATQFPVGATLLGWGCFIAGCAVVDMFDSETVARLPLGIKVFLGWVLLSFFTIITAISDSPFKDSPIAGVIGLQVALIAMDMFALAED